jgi:tetratricopeptide (TPR) repeat protein
VAQTALWLGRHAEAAVEFRWIIRALDRDRTVLSYVFTLDPEEVYTNACLGLTETLCCLGRFAEAEAAAQRASERRLSESQRPALQRRLDLCQQLRAVESRLPAILAGSDAPADVATQRALAEWLLTAKRLPAQAARLYAALFAKQPSLADDLEAQNRFHAASAAALTGCGKGDAGAALDEPKKAKWRKQALAWLQADYEAWAKRHHGAPPADQARAAGAVRAWQESKDLACVRDPSALARLPEPEAQAWRRLWADVTVLAARDPLRALGQARAHAARREWARAAEAYAALLAGGAVSDSETWFEYAAVQLLAGNLQGYRQTCKALLDAGRDQRARPYLVARAATLAPDSLDDPALLSAVSARELKDSPFAFWSLTEQGALCYRAKRYKEAVALFEKSLEAEGKPGAAVLNWLWLALAQHQLGESEEAHSWLDRATTWLDAVGDQLPANADARLLHRHNWLEAHALRREAETLLTPSAGKGPHSRR